MTPEKQRELARTFRARHYSSPIIALPNAFDAASARLFARHDPAAIGTTSGGIAWSAGYPDGQWFGRQEMLDAVARIVRAVDIGVTADVEAGHGDRPEDAAATTAAVVAAGAIGLNLEDSGASSGLLEPDRATAKVAAVRAVAEQEGIDLVVNARTDVSSRAPTRTRTSVSPSRSSVVMRTSTPGRTTSSCQAQLRRRRSRRLWRDYAAR
jgi:2-methylisocitrate lyase-like PEP mutase family enzyme